MIEVPLLFELFDAIKTAVLKIAITDRQNLIDN